MILWPHVPKWKIFSFISSAAILGGYRCSSHIWCLYFEAKRSNIWWCVCVCARAKPFVYTLKLRMIMLHTNFEVWNGRMNHFQGNHFVCCHSKNCISHHSIDQSIKIVFSSTDENINEQIVRIYKYIFFFYFFLLVWFCFVVKWKSWIV